MERRLKLIAGDRERLHEAAMGHLMRWICEADDAALAHGRLLDARLARRAQLALVPDGKEPAERG
jgi:hypothetical protein